MNWQGLVAMQQQQQQMSGILPTFGGTLSETSNITTGTSNTIQITPPMWQVQVPLVVQAPSPVVKIEVGRGEPSGPPLSRTPEFDWLRQRVREVSWR